MSNRDALSIKLRNTSANTQLSREAKGALTDIVNMLSHFGNKATKSDLRSDHIHSALKANLVKQLLLLQLAQGLSKADGVTLR